MSCTVDIPVDGLEALVSEPHLTILTTVEQIFDYDNSICMQYTNNRMEIVFNLAIISNEISRVSRLLAYAVRVEGELDGMIRGALLPRSLPILRAHLAARPVFSAPVILRRSHSWLPARRQI